MKSRNTFLSGFSVVELLVVIAIISILASGTFAMGQRYMVSNFQRNKLYELVAALQTAQLNTMTGRENSVWGVHTSSSDLTLFAGTSYETRDTAFDVIYTVHSTVTLSSGEVVFEAVSGEPQGTTSFTVEGTNYQRIVSLNSLGVVNVE